MYCVYKILHKKLLPHLDKQKIKSYIKGINKTITLTRKVTMNKTSKIWTQINGVWCECETVMENDVMKIIKSTPITAEKEYNDFMAMPTEIKNIMFNDYLDMYCMNCGTLPEFIVRICKEKGINFSSLKREYRKNRTLKRFKF